LCIVGGFALFGLKRGLIEEVLQLLGLVLAILLATRYMETGAAFLGNYINAKAELLGVLSFILIVILVMVSMRFLIVFLKNLIRLAMLSWVDRAGGGVFGAFKGAVLLSIVIWVLMFLPAQSHFKALEEESVSFGTIRGIAPSVYDFLLQRSDGVNSFLDEMGRFLPSINLPESGRSAFRTASLGPLTDSLGLSMEELKHLSPDEIRTKLSGLGIGKDRQEELLRRLEKYVGQRGAAESYQPGTSVQSP